MLCFGSNKGQTESFKIGVNMKRPKYSVPLPEETNQHQTCVSLDLDQSVGCLWVPLSEEKCLYLISHLFTQKLMFD